MLRKILLLFVLLPLTGLGQVEARFRRYAADQGLAQNSVFDVVQDKKGFLWFGTQDGVSRFDGYRFTNFRPDPGDSTSISHNSIRCLFADSRGDVWVGTRGGLNLYSHQTGKFKRFLPNEKDPFAISENVVMALCEDKQGRIWAGMVSKGLCMYDPATGKFTRVQHKENDENSLCSDDVRGLKCDNEGNLWISTFGKGLDKYEIATGKFTHYRYENGQLPYPKMRGALCVDKKNRVWAGAWGMGLCMIDPATQKATMQNDLPGMTAKFSMVWKIMEDSKGRIWIATAEEGLIQYDPVLKRTRQFRHDPDDPGTIGDNNVWSIAEDQSGQIWAGTWQGGVSVYDERLERFGRYAHRAKDSASFPAKTVWAFCEDDQKQVWLGTEDGPYIFQPATGKFFRPPVAKEHAHNVPPKGANIQALCVDKKNRVWMGTAGSGLLMYDPQQQRYKKYNAVEKRGRVMLGGIVTFIICDHNGEIWVGGDDGFLHYNEETDDFDLLAHDTDDPATISEDRVNMAAIKDQDHYWIATATKGICLFDIRTKKFKRYGTEIGGVNIANASSLLTDRYGRLWIGTFGSGLFAFDEQKGTMNGFTEKDGLPNDAINAIVESGPGEFWISTNRGICRFLPAEQNVFSYTVDDGLQGNEYNQNSMLRSRDGRLWFGGVQGFNVFNPKDIRVNKKTMPAVITSFTVLNKPYAMPVSIQNAQEVTLSYRDYFFSFEFAGMEFTNPVRNRYRYMLEGFDEEWVEAGTRRFVTYTNLDPGEYVFRVAASNSDGVWSEQLTSLRIEITPPFWRTTWFYILCALAAALSIWGYIRWRERQLRKEKMVLEAKVKERTHELHEEKEKVTAAHKDIRDSINYARRIQDAILPQEDEFRALLPHSFVLYKPRDVVSGDFYWIAKYEEAGSEKILLAVADCTGHGVPGAFMSMIGHTLLNELVKQERLWEPAKILAKLHLDVRAALRQGSGSDTRDGMDIALVCIDRAAGKIYFAGANRPLYFVREGAITEIKPDKQPIGGVQDDQERIFNGQTIELQENTTMYLFSDGYADQFGGEKGKKFMVKRFQSSLLEIQHLSLEEQRNYLDEAIERWRGRLEQVDDILVVGVKI